MGKMRSANTVLVGKPKKNDPLVRLDIDGRIILKWILQKQRVRVRAGFNCLRIGSSGRLCKHGNEPSGFIKGRDFLTNRLSRTLLH
jgi:hypothetical protein